MWRNEFFKDPVYAKHIKRFLDLLFAGLALVFLSWLFLLIVLIYFLLGRFQVIFSQTRIGYRNKAFIVYKFKTLEEGDTLELQKRRFPWGDMLRFFSLDELPQIYNVLRGDMSWIGPRPLPMEYLPLMNDSQRSRHKVRPGITGWTQVKGRHQLSWKKKFELDGYYVDHVSFRLDVIIFFKTIGLLVTPRKDVSLLEEKFKGN